MAPELNGHHVLDPESARLLAGAASGWNRVLTDPVSGDVLAVDRYRPSAALRRYLSARDGRCRFPGCCIGAAWLDVDHTEDAMHGGATTVGNLAGLCRRHHLLKHHSQWTVQQVGGGTLEWRSPTGKAYSDRPPVPATWTALLREQDDGPLSLGQLGAPGHRACHAPDPPPF
ncbi:HNH endonuclease signature motif containing protein [Arthrobacter sp. NPDC090010]|uniref:HNH endonuclease signature motif containing protein n=1 Tax=Arthrobacter sp. NPDC090010 TaxID=3363942 RepID=UPI003806D608